MVKPQSAISLPRLDPPSPPAPRLSSCSSTRRYKGVRMRNWGRWVSEIRIPRSRDKIWLGSYSTPEKAARAYDAAVVLLRGYSSILNFPDSPPDFATPPCLTSPRTIQATAAAVANANESIQMPQTGVDEELHRCSIDEMAELRPAELICDWSWKEAECSSSLGASEYLTSSDESNLSYSQILSTQGTINPLSPQNFHSIPCSMQDPIYEQDIFKDLLPFETLSHYGFTETSGAATISETFDIDFGLSTDGCLWNL